MKSKKSLQIMSKTDDEKNNSPNIRDTNVDDVTSKDRLKIIKNVLYLGGLFYLACIAGLIILLVLSYLFTELHMLQSVALELLVDLLNPLGYALTTIIGAIIGSSFGRSD